MWWLLLASCQDAFELDRHDLEGFRVAGITVEAPVDGVVRPSVAVVVDGHPWSTDAVELRWIWVDDSDDVWTVDERQEPDAVGSEVPITVPADPQRLGLIATYGERIHRSVVDVPMDTSGMPTTIDVGRMPWIAAEVTGEELQLDARLQADSEPTAFVPEGGFGRFTMRYRDDPGARVVRWMATAGSFFEATSAVSDWAAADISLDDDEVTGTLESIGTGAVTVLGLSVDAVGPSRFVAREVHVGAPGVGLWVADRWLPSSADVDVVAGQGVRGTLRADATSPTGLRLEDPEVVELSSAPDWGTADLACGVDAPFDPGWLLRQRCGVADVEGSTVVVVPESAQ